MALYEITFLTKDESEPGIRPLLEEAGLTIQEETTMGRKRLAYPIKKETQAVYTSYVFDADPQAITEINRKLGLNTNVLRYLIVTKDIARANKEVSKTVREAIAAAEKLEDTVAEEPTAPEAVVEAETPVVEEVAVEAPAEEIVETETPAVEEPVTEPATEEAPAEEEKPAKKPRAKKVVEAPAEENAATATEEDRLKALEDKLGEILKD